MTEFMDCPLKASIEILNPKTKETVFTILLEGIYNITWERPLLVGKLGTGVKITLEKVIR